MADDSKVPGEQLTKQERTKTKKLQTEIQRKLALLLADSRTPDTFKNAFLGQRSIE